MILEATLRVDFSDEDKPLIYKLKKEQFVFMIKYIKDLNHLSEWLNSLPYKEEK